MADRTRRTQRADPEQAVRLGRAIQVLRTELGLSRTELADRAGLSYSYLSEIENGKKQTSAKTLFVLAEVLGVTPSELMAAAERRVRRAPGDAMSGPGFEEDGPGAEGIRIGAPPPSAAARPRWFGTRRPPHRAVREDGALQAQRDELVELLDRLSPEDRELLLDFARRLGRR